MMECPNCGSQNENNRFCSSCGVPLHQDNASNQPYQDTQSTHAKKSPNVTMANLKKTSQSYWKFILPFFKNPSKAKTVSEKDFVFGLITIGAFVFFYALFYFFVSLSYQIEFHISLLDHFLIPLIGKLILIATIPTFIFATFSLLKIEPNIKKVITQFGVYLVPFICIYIVGELFALLRVTSIAYIGNTIGDLGVLLIIPTLILVHSLKKASSRMDLIYTVFIVLSLILLVNDLLGGMYSSNPTPHFYPWSYDIGDIFGS